jgi:hypothetical protein
MYVSSELQAPVIIKMLFLCFMKQCNLADGYGAFVVGMEPSAVVLIVQNSVAGFSETVVRIHTHICCHIQEMH